MWVMNKIRKLYSKLNSIEQKLDLIRLSIGRVESRQLNNTKYDNASAYEYKVFSQWGEDGIIQYLINNINIEQNNIQIKKICYNL